jgi:3-oxoadipate enol-lactonase
LPPEFICVWLNVVPKESGVPVTAVSRTSSGIAYDRAGRRGEDAVVLLHAGVADARMWDALWPSLTSYRDVVRMDLRGFGASTAAPRRALSHVQDVLDTLVELKIRRAHLVGASLGAGVAVEAAASRPRLVASLLLTGPGGSLIAEVAPQLREFVGAESSALARGDLDAAVEANLRWWVDGPYRKPGEVDPTVRDLVRQMQRRAFEVAEEWDGVEEVELDPPVLDRLAEVVAPTLVLVGSLDLDAIHATARQLADGIAGARRVDWPNVAHLPSMERPRDFFALLRDWLTDQTAPRRVS